MLVRLKLGLELEISSGVIGATTITASDQLTAINSARVNGRIRNSLYKRGRLTLLDALSYSFYHDLDRLNRSAYR